MKKSRQHWSQEDDDALRKYHQSNMTYEEMAYKLERTDASISRRIQHLKLKRNFPKLSHHMKTNTVAKFKYKRPDDVFKAYGAPVPWADHKDGCRYPVEPTNQPCNAPCKGVYCEAHSKICGVRYDG